MDCTGLRLMLALTAGLVAGSALLAEDKKPEESPPRILTATPLGIVPGAKTVVVFRGLRLDAADAVDLGDVSAETMIVEKKASAAPTNDLKNRLGDTELRLEIALPADYSSASVPITFTVGGTSTEPFALPVSPADRTVLEVEPNDSYSGAQRMELGQVVLGTIHEKQNVDVFVFAGKAGQKIAVETTAARVGSGLDSFIVLASRDGRRILGESDDAADSRDSRLEAILPEDGDYLIVVQDANDHGGQMYSYRLSARAL